MVEPRDSVRTFVVANRYDGERVDRYVHAMCSEITRSRSGTLVRGRWITINGANVKPSTAVRSGDVVEITVPEVRPPDLSPEPIHVDIIYEDDHTLVIDKPAGLTVHPAPGHPNGTLVNALLHLVPDLAGVGGIYRPGIVHRLDKDTSGLMMVAKNDQAMVSLSRQVKDRIVRKKYVALVRGLVEPEEGAIELPIGRSPHNRKKMAVVRSGREALTRYKLLNSWQHEGDPYSLVEADLITGRTHQIRVHFAANGHPLFGDITYGRRSPLLGRQFLHAARLAFYLPPDETRWCEFESPLPADLKQILSLLGPK